MTTTTTMAGGSTAQTRDAFDVFRVVEREGERAVWKKVGSGKAVPSGAIMVSLDGDPVPCVLQASPIDRALRPIPASKDPRRFPTHELKNVDGDDAGKTVGAMFVNRDASFSLVIDDGESAGPKTRLQMRLKRTANYRSRG